MLRGKEIKHWLKDFYRQILQTMEPINLPKKQGAPTAYNAWHERHIYESNYRRAL